jgi:hypothetical protein
MKSLQMSAGLVSGTVVLTLVGLKLWWSVA